MHIHIKHTNGETFDFEDIDVNMLIVDFKKIVSEKMGYLLPSIRLIYMGKILKDDKKLMEYNLPEKINMIVIGNKVETTPDAPMTQSIETAPIANPETAPNRVLNYIIDGNLGTGERHLEYHVSIVYNEAMCSSDDISREFTDFVRRLYNIHPEATNPAEGMNISHVEPDMQPEITISSLLNLLMNSGQNVPNGEPAPAVVENQPTNLNEQDNVNIQYLVDLQLDISREEIIREYIANHYDTEITANILMSRIGM